MIPRLSTQGRQPRLAETPAFTFQNSSPTTTPSPCSPSNFHPAFLLNSFPSASHLRISSSVSPSITLCFTRNLRNNRKRGFGCGNSARMALETDCVGCWARYVDSSLRRGGGAALGPAWDEGPGWGYARAAVGVEGDEGAVESAGACESKRGEADRLGRPSMGGTETPVLAGLVSRISSAGASSTPVESCMVR
jgi:hypothetical protein